jgi:hypothetical protein
MLKTLAQYAFSAVFFVQIRQIVFANNGLILALFLWSEIFPGGAQLLQGAKDELCLF